jgi:hypothetical protein
MRRASQNTRNACGIANIGECDRCDAGLTDLAESMACERARPAGWQVSCATSAVSDAEHYWGSTTRASGICPIACRCDELGEGNAAPCSSGPAQRSAGRKAWIGQALSTYRGALFYGDCFRQFMSASSRSLYRRLMGVVPGVKYEQGHLAYSSMLRAVSM